MLILIPLEVHGWANNILPIKITSRGSDKKRKESPARVQHALEKSLTYCWQNKPHFCFKHTGTEQPLIESTNKAHVNKLVELSPKHLTMTDCSYPGFNQSDLPLQHSGVNFPCAAKEYNPAVIRAHLSVPLLKKRNNHPSLPLQRHCPQPPRVRLKTGGTSGGFHLPLVPYHPRIF